MVGIVLGLYLLFKGSKRAEEIIGIAFGYSVFIIVLAYCFNMTNLGNNSYIIAVVAGLLMAHYAYHHLSHLFIATLGAIVGCILALIIISLFRIDNDLFVYLLIGGGIFLGFSGHFVSYEIERWLGVCTGAYLIVEGLTTFLGGLPSFLTGI